ncbi:MAG: SDR family oxidoreductase [Candidatus Thorarchaeota archaeon]
MKVIVLGGTGLLGSHLVPLLLDRGHEVTVLTRSESKLSELESQGINVVIGNLLHPDDFIDSLSEQDVVVNIAMPFHFGRLSSKKFHKMSRDTTTFVTSALAIGEEIELSNNCHVRHQLQYGT